MIDFDIKDIMHNVAVKFVRAYLPEAKKPYNLKAVHQPELDIHAVASKAFTYNVTTPPKVIEEGLTAGIKIMYYLAADGYTIKTPLFTIKFRVPGEYNGSETHLPDEVYPEARIRVSPGFKKYLREHVKVEFDGKDNTEGVIGEAIDEASRLTDETVTMGGVLAIYGSGLKIDSDEDKATGAGVFFVPPEGLPVKAETLAINEPKRVKVVVPSTLTEGVAYKLAIFTQSTAKHGGARVKTMREIRSDFLLTAQK